ncbi:copper chaperone PCu(A)C [Sphingomonas oligophenolica]|uniref:Copper chaperone PCu(A)C n=1 Tax=Sphingomonas oligophenolica TaxID=301154 RepID=A0A502CT39_9SPHN|nr:copper chaperone PCu(A)C [Sphingomonas oligophenolica]TPG15259.1 copper chaperone PCu(A)C [Sphingomonas oligophenolica]
MRTLLARSCLAGSAALWLAGCGGPQQVSVDHAWVRLSAIKTNPAAAYFTIHGGPQDRTLVAVSADAAVKAEMHETMKSDEGMSTMEPVAAVPVPAKTEVAFKPGGRHVMLFDVNPGIKPGSALTLTFTFANGERIVERAAVIAAGDPAPQ